MKNRFWLLLICSGALWLASCASSPWVQKEADILDVVQGINLGAVESLVKSSSLPFLFDGEIIYQQNDLVTLWSNLKTAGFTLENAKIKSIGALTGETYRLFAPSKEVKTFFAKYVNQDVSLVTLETDHGNFLLLLGRKTKNLTAIAGFKGPLK